MISGNSKLFAMTNFKHSHVVKLLALTLFSFFISMSLGTQSVSAATKKTTTKKVSTSKKTSKVYAKKKVKVSSKKYSSKSKKRVVAVIDRPSIGDRSGLKNSPDQLALASNVAYVVDQESSQVIFEKNSNIALPIASITKLMTSLIVVEANQDLEEEIEITKEDLDREKGTSSRLQFGAKLTRADLLHIALMSSENRAASALGRSYPGGINAFVAAMNVRAKQLGMTDTHYVDSSGLSSKNVASARDLVKLINAAYQHPLIRHYSTDTKYVVKPEGRRAVEYGTTNYLVNSSDWEIGLQKTGYIVEAGRCLVMQVMIQGRALVMVFLDSKGKFSRTADASRIRQWLLHQNPQA